MNAYAIREKLKKMKEEDRFKLTGQQKRRWCNIGAYECVFLVEYKGSNFCLKEVSGQRCSPELDSGGQAR
jgi:hypothetical protein